MRWMMACVVVVVIAGGCASPEYVSSADYRNRPTLGGSLFAEDQMVIADEAIGRILGSKIALPDKVRIAVMRFEGPNRWAWWSEELSRLDAESVDSMMGKLRACERVADATVLPAMLLPVQRTVPHLRAAAARYQADLLLVYQTTTQTFERQRFLRSKEAKARCLVEVVLIDVRTGIVPFADTAVETFTAKKAPEDFNEAETMHKAELQALRQGLDQIADRLVPFLDAIPSMD